MTLGELNHGLLGGGLPPDRTRPKWKMRAASTSMTTGKRRTSLVPSM
jgi:hypothetical protein